MDGVSAANVAQSVQDVSQILQMANAAVTKQADKLMKVSVEMAVGAAQEAGKGAILDTIA
jgi:hypothetical protein